MATSLRLRWQGANVPGLRRLAENRKYTAHVMRKRLGHESLWM
jgi:hypothetical protein